MITYIVLCLFAAEKTGDLSPDALKPILHFAHSAA